MSVSKRGKHFYLRFRPYGELINVRTSAETKTQARDIERAVMTACRSGDYRALDPLGREVVIRMFGNQGWVLPADLQEKTQPAEELTLWRAAEIFLNYPGIKESQTRERYVYCITNLVEKLGKDRPIKTIWVPQIREYMSARLADGVAPATVNREKGTLSKVFGVLVELQHVESNPCRLVKRLSEKSGEREVYLSFEDVGKIADRSPDWFRWLVMTLYFTGMRRSEALMLARRQVNLAARIIYLGPEATKERHWKRVPIHRDLVPVLEEAMKVQSLEYDNVLLLTDKKGVRPPSLQSIKNPWRRAVSRMDLEPKPRLHDLRHTWRTNARRSGMDAQIAETIMGHWNRTKAVSERYGRMSDEELISAIDQMSFDHGGTEVWVAGK